MAPSHFVIFLKGDLLRISSGLEVILGYFCFTEFGVLELSLFFFVSPSLACLNYLEMISRSLACLNYSRMVRILFSYELTRLEFAVLVIYLKILGSKLPFLFPFLSYFLVPFRFSRTLFRFFSCLFWSNLICWHLKLLARALVSDVFFYFDLSQVYCCGPGQTHMDS